MQKTMGQAVGKIILSGEYAVVFGYPGIAIPTPFTVRATWTNGSPSPSLAPTRFSLSHGERETHHHDLIVRYTGVENEAYLHRILDSVTATTGPLSGNLTITNTIPIGRGMGSSTALVIVICRCLLDHPPLPLKHITLSIENIVNSGHSGLDFEVIWNKKPLLFQKGRPSQILDITMNRLMETCGFSVLIATGKPNETTAEMVKWVKERLGNPHPLPSKGEGMRALQTIAHCTERLLTVFEKTCHPKRSRGALYKIFHDHHRAQVVLGVVPKPVQDLITDIEKSGGTAKVVGAGGRTGGGGMVLALHQKPETLHTIAKRHNMPTITLTAPHPPLLSRS